MQDSKEHKNRFCWAVSYKTLEPRKFDQYGVPIGFMKNIYVTTHKDLWKVLRSKN